jgi:peptidoglycan hydrolase-like protein with peptidoglycan-binding domain
MDAAGFFGLLFLLLGGSKGSAARGGGGGAASKPRQPPQLPPASGGQVSTTPPWPQVVPSGLPPFPGAGWQYDEPPPAAVVQRAGQLVSQLWSGGAGTFRIEQTGGRWIAYRAEVVKSGKKGVVAYRVKGAAKTNTKDRAQAPAPQAPGVPVEFVPPLLEMILAQTAPAPTGTQVVRVEAGHWYQYSLLIQAPAGLAQEIARGIGLAGGVNVAVSTTPPYAVGFQIKQRITGNIPLGVPVELTVGNVKATMTYLRIAEISDPTKEGPPPPPAPAPSKPSKPPPDIWVSVAPSPTEQVKLPTLHRGDGIKPKPPDPNVALMQSKLGIEADGQFGPGTERALRAYQTSHKLAVDGVCGPKTWTSLLAGF